MATGESGTATEIYYTAIRRALANGNAAVMVGAGFSRNAEGGERLSTWAQLATELATALDPEAKPEQFSVANVTQLAEQYAGVFSTPALEDLLKRMIPNDRVAPGKLHDKLLRLPWSEILTTNYDTLLERAAEKAFERAHFTVCCREDIPQSKVLGRRRIVKLHGSFPSQRPFIFTEEDYRTYPQKFAPFVNLVRQSLLENVFCLIGFSGDDPNFLHWLGWIRDVLDKHALPVYLFLDRPPLLGQRKLLEARGVIPVVLPYPQAQDPNDFASRYFELFKKLAEPLEQPKMNWGVIKWPQEASVYIEDESIRYKQLLDYIPLIAAQREIYPGWLVAPRSIRRQFRSSIHQFQHSIDDRWVMARLRTENPAIVMAILSLYAWQQEMLLEPINDDIARLGVQIVRQAVSLRLDGSPADVKTLLAAFSIRSHSDFVQQWDSLVLALARWARQEILESDFGALCNLLEERSGGATHLSDAIRYEQLLLLLYRGKRNEARAMVQSWHIASADPYMIVRKAALNAELGDGDTALTLCKEAVQRLRDSQRMRPGDALLISQEAWACLIAERIQRGRQFINGPNEPNANEDNYLETLNERLDVLAIRGYAAQRELEEVIADLAAEAKPPFNAQYKFGNFDLGGWSDTWRFGTTSELQSKIETSFEWLELADIVGLLVRSTRVNFFVDSYIRAAWWAQYADSHSRILSVLIRSLSVDALKPKDEMQPQHKSGWLSRYQVATFTHEVALNVCDSFLGQIGDTFALGDHHPDMQLAVTFYIEVFSRLVLRIESPDQVLTWGRQLVQIHKLPVLHRTTSLWNAFATALARCIEALPPDYQLILLKEIANLPQMPLANLSDGYADDWIRPFNLLRWYESSVKTNEHDLSWGYEVKQALLAFERTQETPKKKDWQRIYWLEALGVLSEQDKIRVSQVLWRGVSTWPVIQGFHLHAPFRWPAPDGVKSLDAAYIDWLIGKKLSNFAQPSMMMISSPGATRGWGFPTDDDFLNAWIFALQRCSWSSEQFLALVREIKRWWNEEGDAITADLPRLNELRQALEDRFHCIDILLSEGLSQADSIFPMQECEAIRNEVDELLKMLASVGIPFLRVEFLQALTKRNETSLVAAQERLSLIFLGSNDADMRRAANITRWLISHATRYEGFGLERVVDSLISILAARRMPGLLWALGLLSECVSSVPSLLSPNRLQMIDIALTLLFDELKYQGRAEGSGIVDDAVPLLRFKCAEFAWRLQQKLKRDSACVRQWLEDVRVDPLPELRFGRFQQKPCGEDQVS